MRKELLLAAGLLGVLQAQAQSPLKRQHERPVAQRQLINSLLHKQFASGTAQKPTALHQRVVAQASAFVFNPDTDSTTFRYNGAKGSRFDFNTTDYMYTSGLGGTYDPTFRYPGDSNPLNLLADTIKSFSGGEINTNTILHYRNDNKIDTGRITSYDGSGNELNARILNIFNAQGLVTHTYSLQDAGAGITDTTYSRVYVYNAAGTRIESDSIYFAAGAPLHLVAAVTYHYGSSNRVDSTTEWTFDNTNTVLIPSSRLKVTYNTGGKISTLKSYDLQSGSPILSYADSLGYTAGADYFTYYQEDYYDGDGLYTDGYLEIKHVGANNLPDSITGYERMSDNDPFELLATIHAAYTSYDNPEAFTVTIDGDTLGRMTFYYELWDDNLSIKPVAESSNFSVYPNPFTNSLNIDWKGKQNTAATVRLLNVVGQVVYSNKLNLNSGKNTLQLPALTSGQYVLLIQDASGNAWSTKVVKK